MAIAAAMSGIELMCFGIAARTYFLDELVANAVRDHSISTVLSIGADDYALIDRGYARYQSGAIPPTSAGWTDGDFNADHAVDAGDYLLIDQALVAQGGTLSPGLLAERQAAFGDAYVAALAGTVPEPASLGLVTVGAIGLLAGRRRGHA